MGLTKGDTLYFQGTESYYLIAQAKPTCANDSLAVGSLKRKLDTSTGSPTEAKRHHASRK